MNQIPKSPFRMSSLGVVHCTTFTDKIIERAAAKGLKNWPQTELMVRGLEEDFFEVSSSTIRALQVVVGS